MGGEREIAVYINRTQQPMAICVLNKELYCIGGLSTKYYHQHANSTSIIRMMHSIIFINSSQNNGVLVLVFVLCYERQHE